jgi:pimeloyl-ACP methyl ester carboxylesterase
MLHGMFLGSMTTWYFSTGPALAANRRVHMYDLRGHGRSGRPPTGYRIGDQAADLAALVARLAPGEKVSLVGHSYGAVIALRYALDHPETVERLVLVEAPLPIASMPVIETARKELYRGFVGSLTPWQRVLLWFNRRRAGRTIVARAPANPTKDRWLGMLPEGQRTALEAGGRRAERLFAPNGRTRQQDHDQAGRARGTRRCGCRAFRLPGRVLLVYGTRTMDALKDTGRRLARVLPNARLAWLDGTHALPWNRRARCRR